MAKYIQKDGEFWTPAQYKEKYGKLERRKSGGITIINKSFDAYESPITPGKIISTHRQRDEEMREHGCVDYEPTLKNEITENINKEEAALDAAMDATVDEVVGKMSVDDVAKLENEIAAGADIGYERN